MKILVKVGVHPPNWVNKGSTANHLIHNTVPDYTSKTQQKY
jgi:hypothetical protein